MFEAIIVDLQPIVEYREEVIAFYKAAYNTPPKKQQYEINAEATIITIKSALVKAEQAYTEIVASKALALTSTHTIADKVDLETGLPISIRYGEFERAVDNTLATSEEIDFVLFKIDQTIKITHTALINIRQQLHEATKDLRDHKEQVRITEEKITLGVNTAVVVGSAAFGPITLLVNGAYFGLPAAYEYYQKEIACGQKDS